MRHFVAILLLVAPALAQGVQANAGGVVSLPVNAQGQGLITNGSEDAFAFTLPVAQDVRAWTGPGYHGIALPVEDTKLSLYYMTSSTTRTGTMVIDVDDGGPATHGYYSVMTLGNLPAGNYELRVRGYDTQTTGSYTLDLVAGAVGSLVARTQARTLFEASEPNDPRLQGGAATAVNWGGYSYEGVLSTGGSGTNPAASGVDYDLYMFTVPTRGIVTIVTQPPVRLVTSPPVNDTIVFLLDSGFRELAHNDDGEGMVGYSRLRYFEAAPGNVYYVAVASPGAATGAYGLEIFPPPTTSAAAVASVTSVALPAGDPCAGIALGVRSSTNFPLVRPEMPLLGSSFYLDVDNLPTNTVLVRTLLAQGLQPSPLDAVGMPGCQTDIDLNTIFETRHLQVLVDHAFWQLPTIPMSPSLINSVWHAQVGVLLGDSTARLSNRCVIRVGANH